MLETISLKDGALAYTASDALGFAVVGPATSGPLNALQSAADPQQGYDTFSTGKLPDRTNHLLTYGKGPAYLMRCAAANAGTYPSYRRTVHAAYAGNAADNNFPGPITSPGVSTPRNVEIDFGAGYDGGNVTVTGTLKGVAVVEVITAAAGQTVKGVRVFDTITAITKAAVGANAATATVLTGNKSKEGSSSTNGKVTLSGAPLEDLDVLFLFTRGGDVASGTPAFKYSLDGGETWSAEIALAAGGVYSGLATSHGVTATFVGTAVVAGDEFRQTTAGPTSTTQNLQDALNALAADPRTWEGLFLLGPITGAQAVTVEAWIAQQRAAGRFIWVIAEARDQTPIETENAWMTSLLADFVGVTSTYGQLAVGGGGIETVIPGGRGIHRRNVAWPIGTQISRCALSEHPGQPVNPGPLLGVFKPSDGPGLYHDERTVPGLGGSTGRFLTAQTLLGRPGQFFVGDGVGKRSPGTMASGLSDYSLHMNVRVILRACTLTLQKGGDLLARRYGTKTNGTLLESEAKKIEAEVTGFLERNLVSPGHCQSVRVVVSRTEPILSSKKLVLTVFVKPWAYALEVAITLGFEAVT